MPLLRGRCTKQKGRLVRNGDDVLRERVADAERATLAWANATQCSGSRTPTRTRYVTQTSAVPTLIAIPHVWRSRQQALEHEADERQEAASRPWAGHEKPGFRTVVGGHCRTERRGLPKCFKKPSLPKPPPGLYGADPAAKAQRVESAGSSSGPSGGHRGSDRGARCIGKGIRRRGESSAVETRDAATERVERAARPTECRTRQRTLRSRAEFDAYQDARGVVAVLHGLSTSGTTYSALGTRTSSTPWRTSFRVVTTHG